MATSNLNLRTTTSDLVAIPHVDVEIYPYGGAGKITASTASGSSLGTIPLLSVTITKSIYDARQSTFVIKVGPGGPKGVDDPVSWTQVIMPMSLVIIGMRRGSISQIVMIGVVVSVYEDQTWGTNGVMRAISINGMDFTYYFSNYSYHQWTAFGIISGDQNLGGKLLLEAIPTVIGVDSPVVLGERMIDFMLGTYGPSSNYKPTQPSPLNALGPGLMGTTTVPYGSLVFVRDMMGLEFEPFLITVNGQNVDVPVLWAMSLNDGAWLGQFNMIFPSPFWYEFYVMTAPVDTYFQPQDSTTTSYNTNFSSYSENGTTYTANSAVSMKGYDLSQEVVVARVAPFPWVDNNNIFHHNHWDQLPTFTDNSFIFSSVSYDSSEHYNLFYIIPEYLSSLFGGDMTNVNMAITVGGAAINPYSISRYGLKPLPVGTKWFAGYFEKIKGNNAVVEQQLQFLIYKLSGMYTPIPQMLSGTVTLPLRPDILPGNRWLYRPFKNATDYLFYIVDVTHQWTFGGEAKTTLGIMRGLPVDIYVGKDNLLQNIILGNTEVSPTGTFQKRSTGLSGVQSIDMQKAIIGSPGAFFKTGGGSSIP